MRKKPLLFILSILMCFPTGIFAFPQQETTSKTLKVGIYENPPFVIKENNWYTGMAIDLWETVANLENIHSDYIEYSSWVDLIEATTKGEVDIAVTNLTITHERAQILDFTYPWYDAGLRIMTKSDIDGSVWNELKNNGQIHSYFLLFGLLIALTVLLTVFFRIKNKDFPRKWRDGFAQTFYKLIVAINTGEISDDHSKWGEYIIGGLWMLFGIGMVAYVTSTVTATMTKVTLTSEINSLYDLPGKKVGVSRGSVAQQYLESMAIRTIPFDHIKEADEALINNEIHAIVGDAPTLEYWAHKSEDEDIIVVGNIFHPDKYAFAGNKAHATLIDKISLHLIMLHEQGRLKALKRQYFGEDH